MLVHENCSLFLSERKIDCFCMGIGPCRFSGLCSWADLLIVAELGCICVGDVGPTRRGRSLFQSPPRKMNLRSLDQGVFCENNQP
jgi:hypothetical protein